MCYHYSSGAEHKSKTYAKKRTPFLKFIISGILKLPVVFLIFLSIGNAYADKKITIAVLDFEPNNISVYAAKAVSEFFNTEISKKPEITAVERNKLDRIFRELELRMTGAVDTNTAREVGKLVTADKILIGTLTKTGNIFVITARVVDVDTGHIEFSGSERCTREEDLELATRILSVKLINSIAGTNYSAPVRTYLQDDERNRFAVGLLFRYGMLNGVYFPKLEKTADGYQFSNGEMNFQLRSVVAPISYEFTENFGLRLDLKYTEAIPEKSSGLYEFSDGWGTDLWGNNEERLDYQIWKAGFSGYGFSLNTVFKYPIGGFSISVTPGIGVNKYTNNKPIGNKSNGVRTSDEKGILESTSLYYYHYIDENNSESYNYVVHSSDTVYTYFAKLEIGGSAYISRYVEFYISLGVDYHLYSKLVSDFKIKQTGSVIETGGNTSDDYVEFDIMNELNIKNKYTGNMPPEYYVTAGFNFRLF